VAISRVKALSGILFESAFDDRFKRVDSINSRDLLGLYVCYGQSCKCVKGWIRLLSGTSELTSIMIHENSP